MASRFCKLFIGDINLIKKPFVRNSVLRTLGVPPDKAKTLEQRLEGNFLSWSFSVRVYFLYKKLVVNVLLLQKVIFL